MHRKMQELVGEEATYGESTRRIRFDAIEFKDYPVYDLLVVDRLAEVLGDLKSLVIETASDVFITSDNPVFKYNQYLEDIQHHGIIGLGQTGMQIFLPLSPNPNPPKGSAWTGYGRLGSVGDRQQGADPDGLVRALSVPATGRGFLTCRGVGYGRDRRAYCGKRH